MDKPLLACGQFVVSISDYWKYMMMEYTVSISYSVGICKMEQKSDPDGAVVDERLRVGINGLNALDASIIPKIVRGNTNAPTIMIAVKASDMIKEEWLFGK